MPVSEQLGGVARPHTRRRLNRVNIAVVAGFVGAAGIIGALAFEVHSMRPKVAELSARRVFPYESQWVPTVRAVTLQGDSVTIGETPDGRRQVLIAFATTCPHSLASLTAWKRISAELARDSLGRADVFWLSLSPRDSTAAYVAAHGITAAVIFPADRKMLRVYRIKGSPLTLVLDHEGQIVHAHPMELSEPADMDSVLTAAR